MDYDDGIGAPANRAYEHACLSFEELCVALRFAESDLLRVEENHVALQRVYRNEIAALRSQLADRGLAWIASQSGPASDEQLSEVKFIFERRATGASDVARIVRAASRGRTDRVHGLKEIEALAVLLHLETMV